MPTAELELKTTYDMNNLTDFVIPYNKDSLKFDVYSQSIVSSSAFTELGRRVELLFRPNGSLVNIGDFYKGMSSNKNLSCLFFDRQVGWILENVQKITTKIGALEELWINVEPSSLIASQENILRLHNQLKSIGITLVIELTERLSVFLSEELSVLKELHGSGVKLALDDLELGDSRIMYANSYFIDYIKLVYDKDNLMNMKLIVDDLKGKQVVIERVEDFDDLNLISNILKGINFYQGYLFSLPKLLN